MISLLPPNATELERALELLIDARIGDISTPLRDLWSAENCPEALLPWLAWALSVDQWSADWPLNVLTSNEGWIELVLGSNGGSGQVLFYGKDGNRKGFIYAPSTSQMAYGADSGAGHGFLGGSIRRDGNLVCDAGNDGAGSGFDADLLDGLEGSAYLRDIGSSLEQTGYMKLSNGWILQWMWVAALTNRANNTVTFPMTFREDVTPDMRFVFGARVMQIVAGPAELGFREGLEFMAEEYRPAGNPA